MVISQCLGCTICGHLYRLRVGVGFDGYQKIYFDCTECSVNITFALRSQAPNANIEVVENCFLTSHSKDYEVMNFHPNCAFNKDDLHNPYSFPSMHISALIYPHLRYISGRFQSIAEQFDIPNAPHKWSLIKGMMGALYTDYKKSDRLAKQYMSKRNSDMNPNIEGPMFTNPKKIFYKNDKSYSDFNILNEFFDSLFYPKITKVITPIIEQLEKIDTSQLDDFIAFWSDKLELQNQYRYLNTLSDYFRFRDHFGQITLYSRIDIDVDELIVSSKGFDQIKLYYGDAYEALTSNMTIIACLNNIINGRRFDEFKSMSLAKYLEINKANKANPFKDNPIFSFFSEEDIESSIRNGSHHASIWHSGEKVMYRSGGTGAQHNIPYSCYLDLCVRITIKLVAIWIIERYLKSRIKNGSVCFQINS